MSATCSPFEPDASPAAVIVDELNAFPIKGF